MYRRSLLETRQRNMEQGTEVCSNPIAWLAGAFGGLRVGVLTCVFRFAARHGSDVPFWVSRRHVVVFSASAPVFRQDGLCPRILPRAIRCARQGCSAMEGACPQKRPFAFGVLDCWQKAGWFVNKGTGARSCRVAPRVDRMRRLSRKARVGSARRITEGCRKRGGVTKGALSPRGA